MMVEPTHVDGRQTVSLLLYALTTCGWCRKTKALLDQLGVAYDYLYVDQLDTDARPQVTDAIRAWNPSCSFPTLVVGGERCIVGYNEDEIRKVVGA